MSAAPCVSRARVRIVVDSHLRIHNLPIAIAERITAALRIPNPKFVAAARAGRETRWLEEHVEIAEPLTDGLAVPRGAFSVVARLLAAEGIELAINDATFTCPLLVVSLQEPLRPEQTELVRQLSRSAQGIVECTTGGGKTPIAMGIIAAIKQPTLIIVPSLDIAAQFVATVERFLGLRAGLLADGSTELADVTIATPQMALKHIGECARSFGCVIVDEAHRAASPTYQAILNRMPARFRYGMTGTADRVDGTWPIVEAVIGPIRASVGRSELEASGRLIRASYRPVPTSFSFAYESQEDWAPLLAALATDASRNEFLADTIARECVQGTVGLALTGRVEHAKTLERLLLARGRRARAVFGAMPKRQRAAALDEAREGKLDVLIGTQLADEGLDVPRLSRLFLTWPSRAEPRLVQRVGRIVRPHPEKLDAVVFDFVDEKVGVLSWQGKQRAKSFRSECGGAS